MSKKDKNEKNKIDIFIYDNPIKLEDDETFKRQKLISYLSEKIKRTPFNDKSFVIGISGEWGSGKTSFITLLENQFNKTEYIIVKTNPWLTHNSKSIIRDFFNTLSKKLSIFDSTISPLLKTYSELLIGIADSNINKIINFSSNSSENQSIIDEFETINLAIKRLNKKVIISIDDIDRLDNKEITQVLKLLRNNANFANTFFIVAFDRFYLTNALNELNNYKPEKYLSKIFQLEIDLPRVEISIIKEHLIKKLNPILSCKDKEVLNHNLYNHSLLTETERLFIEVFNNIRDVNRFVNSYSISYNFLKGETDFVELFNLELLKTHMPLAYKLILQKPNDFLETKFISNYTLKFIEEKDKLDKLEIEFYLKNNLEKIIYSEKAIMLSISILKSLFPKPKPNQTNNVRSLRIADPIYFERYSLYRLLESDLSEIEFSVYREQSQKQFLTRIEFWIDNGFGNELRNRLERIHDFKSKKDFETMILGIIRFGNYIHTSSLEELRYVFSINKLYELLKTKKWHGDLKFYKNEEEYKYFLNQIFINASYPYMMETELIYNIFNATYHDYNFFLNKESLDEYRMNYFKRYLQETKSFNDNVWFFFRHTEEIIPIQGDRNTYSKKIVKKIEAIELLLNFIRKGDNLDIFITKIIEKAMFNKNQFILSGIIPKIFGEYKKIIPFLSEFEESKFKFLKEFKEFIKELEKQDFKNSIEFEFKDIPIK